MNKFKVKTEGQLIDVYYNDELIVKNIESDIIKEESFFHLHLDNQNYIIISIISFDLDYIYNQILEIDTVIGDVFEISTVSTKLKGKVVDYFGFSAKGIPEFILKDLSYFYELIFLEKEEKFQLKEISPISLNNPPSFGILNEKYIIRYTNDKINIIEKSSSKVINEFKLRENILLGSVSEPVRVTSEINYIEDIQTLMNSQDLFRNEPQNNFLHDLTRVNENYDNQYVNDLCNSIIYNDKLGIFNDILFVKNENSIKVLKRKTSYVFHTYNVSPIESLEITKTDYAKGNFYVNYSEIASIDKESFKISKSFGLFFHRINIEFDSGTINKVIINIDNNHSLFLDEDYVYSEVTFNEVSEYLAIELEEKNVDIEVILTFF